MNRETGGAIGDLDLISQSITDILTTRIGTRVMRREYGSLLPELVDQPFNDATRLRVYAASVMAIMRWEPRVSLTRIQLQGASLQGQEQDSGRAQKNEEADPDVDDFTVHSNS